MRSAAIGLPPPGKWRVGARKQVQFMNPHGWPTRDARRAVATTRCAITFRRRHSTLLTARRSPRCREAARRLFPRVPQP